MSRPEVVVGDGLVALDGPISVLDQLHHRGRTRPKGYLAKGRARYPDTLLELRTREPGRRLVGEREPEEIVIEVDGPVEISDDESNMVYSLEFQCVLSFSKRVVGWGAASLEERSFTVFQRRHKARRRPRTWL